MGSCEIASLRSTDIFYICIGGAGDNVYLLYYLILLAVISCQCNGLPIKPLHLLALMVWNYLVNFEPF